jgi:methionine-rich copper-binding protein CopC
MNSLQRGLLAASAIVLLPALAQAHARLRSAEPLVGGTVQTAPTQVEITFSSAIEPRFSSIAVTDGAGNQVDRRDVHVVGDDAHRLAVSLGPIPAGEYRVEWHATTADTHRTEGSYTFTVAP